MAKPVIKIPLIIVLFIINIIIFWNVFPSFIYVDEFELLYSQRFVGLQELGYRVFVSSSNYLFRPIYYFIFGIYYKIFQFNLSICYIIIFMAHLAAAWLVYKFLLKVGKSASFSAIGSILFLTYCGTWEAVGSIGGILYPVVTIFMLSAFMSYLDNKLALTLIFFTLALFTHQASIVLLPLVVFYEILMNKKRIDLRLMKDVSGIAIVSLIYLLFYLIMKIFSPAFVLGGRYVLGPHFILNGLSYMSTLIIPVITSYSMSSIIPRWGMGIINMLQILLMLVIPLVCVYIFWRGPGIIKFFLAWVILSLLPFSFFILPPVSRYLYVASVGFVSIVAFYIDRLINDQKYRRVGIILFMLIFVANLGGMVVYQKLFYNKKELRRQILNQILSKAPKIKSGSRLIFIDLPIREDEVKGMIFLWYKNDKYDIKTINANNFNYRQTYDIGKDYGPGYIFVYDCVKKSLILVKSPN